MKKVAIATLTTLLSACQFTGFGQTQISSKNFIGNWECRMDGGNISTANQISLGKDGKANYLGKIMLPKDNPMFQYDVKRTGSWAYANHTLSYQFTKSAVTPNHSEQVKESLKTDKELKAMEKEYYNAIHSQMTKPDQKSLNLSVSNVTPNSFSVMQNLNQTTRSGVCVKVVK